MTGTSFTWKCSTAAAPDLCLTCRDRALRAVAVVKAQAKAVAARVPVARATGPVVNADEARADQNRRE